MTNQAESKKMEIEARKQVLKVNGSILQVTKISAEGEKVAKEWEFKAHEKVTVKCRKFEGTTKISCEVVVGGKSIISNTSAQGMFDVVSSLTGIKRERIDSMYKKANPFRKEGKTGNTAVVVDVSKLEDVKL